MNKKLNPPSASEASVVATAESKPKLYLPPDIAEDALTVKDGFKTFQRVLVTFFAATESREDLLRLAGKSDETPKERRARWLRWYEEEEAVGNRGAIARTAKREQKINPKADRSYIGKQIKLAREERVAAKKQGAANAVMTPTANTPFLITRVIDGQKQN